MGTRVPGVIGFAAAMSLVAACADAPDQPESIRQCALRQGGDSGMIVDDRSCNGTAGGSSVITPGYGWYYTPITPNGTTLHGPGAPARGGTFTAPPGGVKVNPAPPIAPGRTSGIVRGGLGVKGGGSSGS